MINVLLSVSEHFLENKLHNQDKIQEELGVQNQRKYRSSLYLLISEIGIYPYPYCYHINLPRNKGGCWKKLFHDKICQANLAER